MSQNSTSIQDQLAALELERQKLELAEFKKPAWKKLNSWHTLITLLLAGFGVWSWFASRDVEKREGALREESILLATEKNQMSTERIDFEREKAEAKRDEANADAERSSEDAAIHKLAKAELIDEVRTLTAERDRMSRERNAAQSEASRLTELVDSLTTPQGDASEDAVLLSGIVTDIVTGEPVPGIQVQAITVSTKDDKELHVYKGVTSDKGLYLIRLKRHNGLVRLRYLAGDSIYLCSSTTTGNSPSQVNQVVPAIAVEMAKQREKEPFAYASSNTLSSLFMAGNHFDMAVELQQDALRGLVMGNSYRTWDEMVDERTKVAKPVLPESSPAE